MLELKQMEPTFAVAPQLSESDFAAIASLGFKTIICNRPDNEEPGQLSSVQAQALAQAQGMQYVYLPVTTATLSPAIADAFAQALRDHPGPTLAHCKSGTRSCILWTMTHARNGSRSVEELLDCAARGGYDISRMRSMIEAYMAD